MTTTVRPPAGRQARRHDVARRGRPGPAGAAIRKVGHAGTLDPMATGLLVCGVGRGTRLLGTWRWTRKTYEATIRLGAATVTDDREGEVLTTADAVGA